MNLLALFLFNINIISALESKNAEKDLQKIIHTIISLRKSDGKIEIPASVKHIKLDIGLSYSAPVSQQWLSNEDDLFVFGFEPNPACVESILQGAKKRVESHGDPLKTKFIGKNFF